MYFGSWKTVTGKKFSFDRHLFDWNQLKFINTLARKYFGIEESFN